MHSVLPRLIDAGYFAGKAVTVDMETTLQAVTVRAFADYEENNPVGYPLAWESVKDGLVQLLRQVIAQDLAELSQSGLSPGEPGGRRDDALAARLAGTAEEPGDPRPHGPYRPKATTLCG